MDCKNLVPNPFVFMFVFRKLSLCFFGVCCFGLWACWIRNLSQTMEQQKHPLGMIHKHSDNKWGLVGSGYSYGLISKNSCIFSSIATYSVAWLDLENPAFSRIARSTIQPASFDPHPCMCCMAGAAWDIMSSFLEAVWFAKSPKSRVPSCRGICSQRHVSKLSDMFSQGW